MNTMSKSHSGTFCTHPIAWADSLLVCVLLVFLSPVLQAAESKQPSPPDAAQKIRRVGPNLYELGNVRIDAGARTISCRGRINMDRGGPIELLACTERGKRHETILVLDVEPLHLQLALLLLDLDMGRNPAVKYPEGSSENERDAADTVSIRVRWKENAAGKDEAETVEHPAHDLLYNVKKKRVMQPARWAFIGSRQVQGKFGAKMTGSLVVTYHDPLGILELALEEVNSDIWYEANARVIPEVGTEVDMIIQAPEKEDGRE
jgi:hypothetical protein